MSTCKVVRVKAWHTSQGDFVEINAADFDAAVHERYEDAPVPDALPPPPAQVPA